MNEWFTYTVEWLERYAVITDAIIVVGILLSSVVVRWVLIKLLRVLFKKEKIAGWIEAPLDVLIVIGMSVLILNTFERTREISRLALSVFETAVVLSLIWAGYNLANYIGPMLKKASGKSKTSPSDEVQFALLTKSIKVGIVILGAILIMQNWGHRVTGLLAGLGIGGVVFALASKDTFLNLFGSIMIMLDKPFLVGDWIVTTKIDGTVEEIGFRSTKIRTHDQGVITVPNSVMSNEVIMNWSRTRKRKIMFTVYVSHDTNTNSLKMFIQKTISMLREDKEIQGSSVQVYCDKISTMGIEVPINFFVKTTDGEIITKLRTRINLGILDIVRDTKIKLSRTSEYLVGKQ